MIKKIGRKYIVVSETAGRRFGAYRTLAQAKRRLRQVEFFRHAARRPKSKRRQKR